MVIQMCYFTFLPYDSDGPKLPLPRGRPQLTWAVTVDMVDLGASLQAFSDTPPQVTTLRLIHRFGAASLSRLPQELIEQIIETAQRHGRSAIRKVWKRDFRCFQGICRSEDHFEVYNEHVESLWQKLFIEENQLSRYENKGVTKENCTKDQKVDMLHGVVMYSPKSNENSQETYNIHDDGRYNWLARTCLCMCANAKDKIPDKIPGKFTGLNKILESHFGLEALILHELLSEHLYNFLPNEWEPNGQACSTRCFLTIASSHHQKGASGWQDRSGVSKNFARGDHHMAECYKIEPAQLSMTEQQKACFKRAMRCLGLSVRFHLSELDALVQHPIQDEMLQGLCSCGQPEDICPYMDVKSWDKPCCIEEVLKHKSRELAKESWPKLMLFAASDAVTPSCWC